MLPHVEFFLGRLETTTCEWNWVIKLLKPFSSCSSFSLFVRFLPYLSFHFSIFRMERASAYREHVKSLVEKTLFSSWKERKRIRKRWKKWLHSQINYAFEREKTKWRLPKIRAFFLRENNDGKVIIYEILSGDEKKCWSYKDSDKM